MGTCSTLKTCLDAFKVPMQQQLQEAQIKLMADKEHKLAFLKQEVHLLCKGSNRKWKGGMHCLCRTCEDDLLCLKFLERTQGDMSSSTMLQQA